MQQLMMKVLSCVFEFALQCVTVAVTSGPAILLRRYSVLRMQSSSSSFFKKIFSAMFASILVREKTPLLLVPHLLASRPRRHFGRCLIWSADFHNFFRFSFLLVNKRFCNRWRAVLPLERRIDHRTPRPSRKKPPNTIVTSRRHPSLLIAPAMFGLFLTSKSGFFSPLV